jgi:hypothetical protein
MPMFRTGASRLYRLGSLLISLILTSWAGPLRAEVTEADLKAAFVYNFTKFVEWPAEAFNSSPDSVTLCLLGAREPLFDALAEMRGMPVKNRSLRVRSVTRNDTLRTCQMLIVAESEAEHFETVLRRLEGVPVLTVNGSDRFLDAGGIIGLTTEGPKVRFEINLAAARRNNLVLSSNLLKLAKKVRQ